MICVSLCSCPCWQQREDRAHSDAKMGDTGSARIFELFVSTEPTTILPSPVDLRLYIRLVYTFVLYTSFLSSPDVHASASLCRGDAHTSSSKETQPPCAAIQTAKSILPAVSSSTAMLGAAAMDSRNLIDHPNPGARWPPTVASSDRNKSKRFSLPRNLHRPSHS